MLLNAVSYLARSYKLDTIVPLDDYDVEMAATLREHMRLPGLGDSIARFFRDKLAMRVRRREMVFECHHSPDFSTTTNCAVFGPMYRHRGYSNHAPKRVQSASASCMMRSKWRTLDELGDKQSHCYLLEQFVPGAIYHVDSVVVDGTVQFSIVSKYARLR